MIFTLSIVTRSALRVEIDEFANFSKLRSFLETKLPDISKVTVILEKINSIIDGNKSFRGLPADLFPISFFVLKYFSNFRLPTFFWDLQLPTSFRGSFYMFKKKCKKNIYLRVQNVRVWIISKKSFWDFLLPTSVWDFCLPTFFTELPNIFLKNMQKKICTLVYNMTESSKETSKFL